MRRSDRIIGISVILSAITALSIVWVLGTSSMAQANGKVHGTGTFAQGEVSITASCLSAGESVGATITIPHGMLPATFDVFVTYHVPGSSVFVEVPGSRMTVTATSSPFISGALNIENVPSAANTLRIETTLSNEKSDSFECFGGVGGTETPHPTHTVVPTATKTSTIEATNTPAATATNTVPPGATSTSTPTQTMVPTATQTTVVEATNTVAATATNTVTSVSTSTPTPGSSVAATATNTAVSAAVTATNTAVSGVAGVVVQPPSGSSQVLGTQATPARGGAVSALPSTGSGSDDTRTTALSALVVIVLACMTISVGMVLHGRET